MGVTGNLVIGVAPPDEFSATEYNLVRGVERLSQVWFVKSKGNADRYFSHKGIIFESQSIQVGDVITVTLDMEEGIVTFEKRDGTEPNLSVALCEPKTTLSSPLSLFVGLDYEGDYVSI